MKTKPTLRLAFPLASAIAALLASTSLHAAPLTWDNGAVTGNWNTTDLNWTSLVTPWSNATPDDAILDVTGVGTVTLSEAITAGSLTVNTAGYTIDTATFGLTLNSGITANESATIQSGAGGSLILGANNAWSVAATKTLAVSSTISGAAFGITKTGTGALTLSNTNTYTGLTTVTVGTLNASAVDALGTGAALLVNGGTLALSTFNNTVGAVTLTSGSITGTGGILTGSSFALESGTASAILAGSGAVTKTTAGSVTLSGTNTFSGQLTVQNGTLSVGTANNVSANGPLGNSALPVILGNTGAQTGTLSYTGGTVTSTKPFTMATGGTGDFNVTTGGTSLTLSGLINGSGALSKSGSGILILTGATNSYSGGTIINGGTLTAATDAVLGTGGGITFEASATMTPGSVTYARTITLNNGAIASFNGNNPTFSGNVTGTGGVSNLNNFGSQVTLSGTGNTFEGQVRIGSGGTTSQAYRFQLSSLADSATANGTIRFSANSVTHADGSVFQYNGSANLVLANRLIEIASSGATPSNGHQIRSSGAGTLSINTNLSVTSTTAQRLSLGGTNTGNNAFNGNITNGASSALGLTKANNGNWNLSGTNTYTGTTVMGFNNPAGGNLTFQGIQSLSPSTTLSQTHVGGTGGHGTFKILDDAASPASRSAVNLAMTSSNTSNGMTLFVGNNNTANGGTSSGTTTGSTIALGNLNFTQSAVGNTSQQLNVTGADSYVLQISNVNLPSISGNWNGILNPTTAPLTVSGNVQQVAGSTAGTMTLTLSGTAAGNIVSGEIRDSLDGSPRALTVLKNSAATWTLSNNNTFSGGITFSAGVLNINHAGALGTGTVTIGAGTFNNTTASTIINANNNPIAWNGDSTFTGTRSLDLGTGNVTLGGNRNPVVSASTLTMGGVVSGAFGINLGGNGRLILSNAASTYTGKTSVGNNAGGSLTLQVSKLDNLSANSSLGAPTTAALGLIQLGSVSNSSTLDYIGTSASSTDRQVQIGSASNGSGNAIINNNSVDPTHTLTFSNAAFNVAAGGANSSNRTIRLGGANTGDNTVSGAIVNNTGSTVLVGVAKLGTGTWVLSGNSSYTSGTTVENGILKVNTIKNSGVNSAVGAGTIIAFGGATTTGTLQYTGAGDSSDRNIRIGTTTVGNTGGGVLNSSGAGALIFTAPTFNTAVATVTAARNLTLGGTYTTTANEIQGAIVNNDTGTGGTVSITKSGASTWTLTGTSTYTGATTISDGTLLVNSPGSLDVASAVTVNGGTLGGTGTIGGTVTVAAAGNLAPGASAGTLSITGNLDISAMAGGAGELKYELNALAGTNDLTAVTGTLNIGTLALDDLEVTNLGGLQAGTYTLITSAGITGTVDGTVALIATGFNGQLQISGNNLQLAVTAVGGSTYATWIAGFPGVGLLNGVNDDPDFDGIDNGMEMVLGGNPATGMDTALLPTLELVTDPPSLPAGDYLLFTYRRTAISEAALVAAACETDTDLVAPWTPAVNAVSGVVIQEDLNYLSFTPAAPADTDRVRVYVPRGANTKLFGRLNVVVP